MSKRLCDVISVSVDPANFEDVPIEVLVLKPRIEAILLRIEICTIELLLNSECSTILSIKGIGPKNLEHIITHLEYYLMKDDDEEYCDEHDCCKCEECPSNPITSCNVDVVIKKKAEDPKWSANIEGNFLGLSIAFARGVSGICSYDGQPNLMNLTNFACAFDHEMKKASSAEIGLIAYEKMLCDYDMDILDEHTEEFIELIMKLKKKYYKILSGFIADCAPIVKDAISIVLNVMCLQTICDFFDPWVPELTELIDYTVISLKKAFFHEHYSLSNNYSSMFGKFEDKEKIYDYVTCNIVNCPDFECVHECNSVPFRYCIQAISIIQRPEIIKDCVERKQFELCTTDGEGFSHPGVAKSLISFYNSLIVNIKEFILTQEANDPQNPCKDCHNC